MDSCIPNWYEAAFWWGVVVVALSSIWAWGRMTELKWDVEYYRGEASRQIVNPAASLSKGSGLGRKPIHPRHKIVELTCPAPTKLDIPGAVDDDHLEYTDKGEDDDGNLVILSENTRGEK